MDNVRGPGCFVIGADSLLIECGEILLREGFEVKGIITSTERIAAWAAERDLEVVDPDEGLAARLGAAPFDYLFSIAHLALIGEEILRLPRRGAINFHDGPLPRYAGLNAPAWALMNGEREYGVTWHRMEAGADTGAILEQALFPVAADDTSLTLNTRCFEAAIDSFERLARNLRQDTLSERDQDASERTYFARYRRPHAACVLDWTRPAVQLEALVRALDFGPYRNPLGLPKLVHGNQVLAVGKALAREGDASRPAGTVLEIGGYDLLVQTGDGALSITHLTTLGGRKLEMSAAIEALGLEQGTLIDSLDESQAEDLTRLADHLARGEVYWAEHLSQLEPLELPQAEHAPSASTNGHPPAQPTPVEIPATLCAACPDLPPADVVAAACAAFLGRVDGRSRFDLAFADESAAERSPVATRFAASEMAWRVDLDPRAPAAEALGALAASLGPLRERGSWLLDLPPRSPALAERGEFAAELPLELAVSVGEGARSVTPRPAAVLSIVVSPAGDTCRLIGDPQRLHGEALEALAAQLANYLTSLARDATQPLEQVALLDSAEREHILVDWNTTAADYEHEARVHELFEEQVARTPEACALVFGGERLTYRELDGRADRLASHLASLGAGSDRLVGLYLERSIDLVVAMLGVLKCGAAYLPLDPSYPSERLAFMLRDSRAPLVLTTDALADSVPADDARVVRLDGEAQAIAAATPADRPAPGDASNLAYVIYTSGSTGEPKGVMVEHRNVVSFFAGMDERIPHDPPGTWLAVTSLSFDISVLELLWTLARGFEVVLYADGGTSGSGAPERGIDFAMFLWGNDAGQGRKKYELLLESARFADNHGFSSVWTPERHFHAFGGPYPNSSLLSAAVAAVTERVGIRSGSCVAPLHHPLRIAEEWAVVDNLSEGRAGLGIAAGWQPHDFVLRPENYADNRECMFRDIETIRRLWRGEALQFPGPEGEAIERVTYPRPIQPELPIWLTTAGNPDTYERAGEIGAHLLTHLLGQPLEEVAEKIRSYRESLAAHGHDPEAFTVTLMLHTFIGEDIDEVRELVRGPMKAYLGSAVDLVKKFAWTFPAFKRPGGVDAPVVDIDVESLTGEEAEAILENAFLRYFDSSGLFGTPESCVERIDQLKAIGVDEVGCLVDYGLPTDVVLASLPALARLREAVQPAGGVAAASAASNGRDDSLPSLVARHGVTHLQCTPSMARMLLDHTESRAALAGLEHLLVGGEALPAPLAADLGDSLEGTLTNMYGPTETTIWSATQSLSGTEEAVPIGRPIANTRLYILDDGLQPVPVGVPGELYIGGDGVVRGYLDRPELTAERFVPDPFVGDSSPDGGTRRMYRTGDRARYRPDGVVEFLGRTDHQVKVRGHRIELGEIEAVLGRQETVESCAVIVREDAPGDQRIVAYHTPAAGADVGELREALSRSLPEYMLPTHFVPLDRLPLTPNGKIDRKVLPPPGELGGAAEAVFVAPEEGLEATLAEIWRSVLRREQVGVDDNFFDIGGHSLLVVQVHRSLREKVSRPVELTDLYRFPTVRSLADYLGTEDEPGATRAGADRGLKRRDAVRRRRGRRAQET
ncbi:MAG: LLM class flavin-dependent oxidoreductase [Planctomycetota bacterium]|jgi:natural product biosynthesis luciferase-like monooxygenase protein|nr:LLM class flavin-dependent oxidoreductase [Planctomycetota bacterium]